jgi:predicted transposase YdaD
LKATPLEEFKRLFLFQNDLTADEEKVRREGAREDREGGRREGGREGWREGREGT